MIISRLSLFLVLASSATTCTGFVPPNLLNRRTDHAVHQLNVREADAGEEAHFNCISRRSLVGSSVSAAALALVSTVSPPAFAAPGGSSVTYETYTDTRCGFSIQIPSTWQKSEQTLPNRSRIVFFVDPSTGDGEDKTLAFIAYNDMRDDFTTLSSMGSLDQVGQSVILPRGKVVDEKDTSESELIKAESKKSAYFYDYTTQVEGQPKRHFQSIFALFPGATGGAGGILATFTVQTPESRYGEMKEIMDAMVSSYGKA